MTMINNEMQPAHAWCWADGRIEFGETPPEDGPDGSGAIVIARGESYALRAVVARLARMDQNTPAGPLVPGVAEAIDGDDAINALIDWQESCRKGNGDPRRLGVVFL